MAEVGLKYPTLGDLSKQLDPNHKIARAINMMSQMNAVMKRLPMMQGNLPVGHLASVLTGLPTAAWRKLNAGSQPSTDSHAQIQEGCGMCESWQQTDVKLAQISGNVGEYRLQKGRSHLESITQEAATTFFYGDKSSPEKFLGLAPRFSALTGASNSKNVLSGGGSGSDNTSVWMMVLGFETLTGIYPQGSQGGVKHTDHNVQVIQNAGGVTGALMEAFVDHWAWDIGIALLDWRYVIRICNIDVSNLVAESSAADLLKLLIKAYHRLPQGFRSKGIPVICANPTVTQMLDIQVHNASKTAGPFGYMNWDGEEILAFRKIPILETDAITNTEGAVA